MGLFGPVEVAFYQLTDVGVMRAQNPTQTKGLDTATKGLLHEFASHGGTMEWDEMKMYGSIDSPSVLSVALRRLVDLGYVTPVQTGAPA